jgi:hypothetical protein
LKSGRSIAELKNNLPVAVIEMNAVVCTLVEYSGMVFSDR